MKDNLDKRVVEFEFDNSKFEKNIKQSTESLDNLKASFNFKQCEKSAVNLSVKFKALEVAAISAISNITNRVVDLGVKLIKSLSVDNIMAGWNKFADKTIAVGTLMSQTIKVAGRTIEDASEKMEIVTEQLERLNWFTDETSYNFIDMVNSIGKFTAAGQDLDVSVKAMEGIANWAALSGQNATTASRAMYQLAQAMGKGYVMRQDWMSIENSNMATLEFKQTVLETAAAMGKLNKVGNEFVSKTGKKITAAKFSETLADKWFTNDILVASLEKYSAAVERLYEISEETGLTAAQVIKRYGSELDAFGVKAFKAAQEARTFSDSINAIKDAVSTGWMTTAENIFGDYEEAKSLWSDLADSLYDAFVEAGNFRNEYLAVWKEMKGREDLFAHDSEHPEKQGAFWNIYDAITAIKDSIKSAWESIFPRSRFSDMAERSKEIADNFKRFTENLQKNTTRIKEYLENSEKLQKILEGLLSVLKFCLEVIKNLIYSVSPLIDLFVRLTDKITTFVSNTIHKLTKLDNVSESLFNIGNKIYEFLSNIINKLNFEGFLNRITGLLEKVRNGVRDVINEIRGLTSSSRNVKRAHKILPIKDPGGDENEEVLSGPFGVLQTIMNKIREISENIKNYITDNLQGPIVNFYNKVIAPIVRVIKSIFLNIKELISSLDLNKLSDSFINVFDSIKNLIMTIGSMIPNIVNKFSLIINNITRFVKETGLFDAMWQTFVTIMNNLRIVFMDIGEMAKRVGTSIKNTYISLRTNFVPWITNIKDMFAVQLEPLFLWLKDLGQRLLNIVKNVGNLIMWIFENIDNFFRNVYDYLSTDNPLAQAVNRLLDTLGDSFLKLIDGLTQVFDLFKRLFISFADWIKGIDNPGIQKAVQNAQDGIEKVLGTDEQTSLYLMITAITIAVIAILKMVYDLVWLIKAAKFGFAEMFDSVADLLYGIKAVLVLKNIGIMIAAAGVAMYTIAKSFETYKNIEWSDMAKGLTVFGIFAGLLITLTAIAGRSTSIINGFKTEGASFFKGLKEMATGTFSRSNVKYIAGLIISFGLSMELLAHAIKKIAAFGAENQSKDIWRAVGVISALFAVISLMTAISDLISRAGTKIHVLGEGEKAVTTGSRGSSFGKILGLTAMMLVLINGIIKLSFIPETTLNNAVSALTKMIVFITIATGYFTMMAGEALPKLFASIGAIFASILAFSAGLLILSTMSKEQIAKGMGAIIVMLMTIFLLTTTMMETADGFISLNWNENSYAGFGSILKGLASIINSLVMFALSIGILKNFNLGDMVKALVPIQLLLITIGGIAALLGITGSKSTDTLSFDRKEKTFASSKNRTLKQLCSVILSLIPIIIAIGLISKSMDENITKNMWNVVGMISALLGVVGGIGVALSAFSKQTEGGKKFVVVGPKALNGVIGVILSLAALLYAVWGLQKLEFDFNQSKEILGQLTLLLLAISGITLVMTKAMRGEKTGARMIVAYSSIIVTMIMMVGLIHSLSGYDFLDMFHKLYTLTIMVTAMTGVVAALKKISLNGSKTPLKLFAYILEIIVLMGSAIGLLFALKDMSITQISTVLGGITVFLYAMSGVIAALKKIALNGSKNPLKLLSYILEIVVLMGAAIGLIFALKNMNWEQFATVLGGMSVFLYAMTGVLAILKKIGNYDSKNPLKLLSYILEAIVLMGAAIGLIFALKDISLKQIATTLSGITIFLYTITGVLAILKKIALNGSKNPLKLLAYIFEIIVLVATAIASLLLLKDMSVKQMDVILSGITIFLYLMLGVIAALKKLALNGSKNPLKLFAYIFEIIVLMGAAIASILILKDINPDQIAAVLTGMIVFLYAMMGVITALKKISLIDSKKPLKLISYIFEIMLIMGAAIASILILKDISPGQIATVLGGMIVFLYAVTGVLAILKKIGNYGSKNPYKLLLYVIETMLLIGAAITSLLLLKDMSLGQISTILGSITVFLYAVTGVLAILKKIGTYGSKNPYKSLAYVIEIMLLVGTAIVALLTLKDMSFEQIASILGGIVIFIGLMTGVLVALKKIALNGSKNPFKSLVNIIPIVAMVGVAIASLLLLENYDLERLAVILGALVVFEYAMVGFVALLNKTSPDFKKALAATATMLLVIVDFAAFVGALWVANQILGNIDWETLGKLFATAGGFAAFAAIMSTIGLIGTKAAVGILAIAGALIVLALSMAAFAAAARMVENVFGGRDLLSGLGGLNNLLDDSGELKITPVVDLSNVKKSISDMNNMFGSVGNIDLSGTTALANAANLESSRRYAQQAGITTTNNNSNDVYNYTFNVTTNNPEELVDAADELLQNRRSQSKLARGGV